MSEGKGMGKANDRGGQLRVGLIGLGKMGAPMGRNLLAAGFPLTVYNRSRPATDALVAAGAHAAANPAGVAQAADVILTSLPDPAAVEQVYLGDHGLASAAHAGQVYVDTSTVGPGTSRKVAQALAAQGAAFLDAPVSGGVAGAEAGTLTVMIGGDAAALEQARPVLAAIGQRLNHVGPTGAGAIVKLINQLLVAINMAGVAEGLVLGVKAGANPQAMLDVLATSFGSSRMLERGIPLIMDRNFGGGTPVDLIRKDLGLISDLANELGVPLPEGLTAQSVFNRAHADGLGAQDMTAVVKPLEQEARVEVKK